MLVVAFFGFGLFYGRETHLTIVDYWRWFVVHIWVESIFEFFGVAVISLFLVTLGLVSAKSALRVAYLTAILVFISGIPGTAHHYFWYGGPSLWLGIGGVFSSLEPIPLILLVVRAWMEYKSIKAEGREFPYRWPLYFITASSVWNFVGGGMFGFLINLPIINYYEHATYLTSNHGHTALFGVYGMLAIALILFSWRGLVETKYWNDGILRLSFWGLNVGLFLMFTTGLLPIGLLQVWTSYDQGFWYARSAAFYEQPLVQTLGNLRAIPDGIIIVLGAFPLLYFLLRTYPRCARRRRRPLPTRTEQNCSRQAFELDLPVRQLPGKVRIDAQTFKQGANPLSGPAQILALLCLELLERYVQTLRVEGTVLMGDEDDSLQKMHFDQEPQLLNDGLFLVVDWEGSCQAGRAARQR